MDTDVTAPNHHAHFPLLRGWKGLIAGLTMALGKSGDRADAVLALAGVHVGDRVLDIGSGPGVALRRAAKRGASVLGVEPAPVMRRLARVFSPGVEVRAGVAEQLPVDDDSIDVTWSVATVHHWRDIGRGLAEVRRVLRPGGRFIAAERDVPDDAHGLATHGWRPAQVEAFVGACRAAGFVDVRVEPVGPGHAVVAVKSSTST